MNITLHRAEGPADSCVTLTAGSYDEAQNILTKWGQTAPENGNGYDKVDVKVVWPDGLEWSYRFDLQRGGTERDGSHFETNLKNRLQFYSGCRCAPHLTDARYQEIISSIKHRCPGLVEGAAEILEKHFNS